MRRFSIALVLIVVLGAAATSGATALGWSIQHTPNPTGGDVSLTGVSCTSGSACTAVGDYFTGKTQVMLAERWNGTKWSVQRTPTGGKSVFLDGVSCTAKSACTAVGDTLKGTRELALAERWNGTKWSIQRTPNPVGATGISLSGVSCTSKRACMAVGSTAEVTLAEHWNGTKWSIQHTPNPTGAQGSALSGVSCTSGSACTAVGDYDNGTTTLMLAERWNGTRWSIQHTPNPTGATKGGGLNGVACTSKSACTAVGAYGKRKTDVTLAERWNGTKWSIQHTPNPADAVASGLLGGACTSKRACTAVGLYDNKKTGAELTLAERWNGTKWSIQRTPNPSMVTYLSGVSCPSRSVCTAVGLYGKSTTSGTLAERWNGG